MLRLEKGQAGWSGTNNRPLFISLHLSLSPSSFLLSLPSPHSNTLFPPPATLTSHPPSFNHDSVCSWTPPPHLPLLNHSNSARCLPFVPFSSSVPGRRSSSGVSVLCLQAPPLWRATRRPWRRYGAGGAGGAGRNQHFQKAFLSFHLFL